MGKLKDEKENFHLHNVVIIRFNCSLKRQKGESAHFFPFSCYQSSRIKNVIKFSIQFEN